MPPHTPLHPPPPLARELLPPGTRLGVAVSGGADSVALLRLLHAERDPLGLQLTVLHVHHGLRGAEADSDAGFVRQLAHSLNLPALQHNADTPTLARERGNGLEEAAREVRYAWFSSLLAANTLDLIATAHTLDDQAETVLHRLLRGAWTEGLGGIHPVLRPDPTSPRHSIVRPLLAASHAQLIAWLQSLGQPWREDSSNQDPAFTRNRIRHQLLPQLATFNPALPTQLATLSQLAREDEAFWEAEVARTLPGLLLPGRAVRGGGRSSSTHPHQRELAFEAERLRPLPPALVRRLLRAAARELGPRLDFDQTARLYALLQAPAGRPIEITPQLRAERTPRELRLLFTSQPAPSSPAQPVPVSIPGEATLNGWHVQLSWAATPPPEALQTALLRTARPGDRLLLRHSSGAPRKLKEVLERLGIPPADRPGWPILEYNGQIIATPRATLEPSPLLHAVFTPVGE